MSERTWWLMIVSHQVGWISSRFWLLNGDRIAEVDVFGGVVGGIGALITFGIIRLLWAGVLSFRRKPLISKANLNQ